MAGSVWVKVFPPEPAGGGGGGIGWAALDGGAVTTYTDGDGVAWNVHTYLANGSVTVTRAGLVRALLVAGGSCSSFAWADGGRAWEGLILADEGAHPVAVGAGGTPATAGGASSSVFGKESFSGFLAPTNGVSGGQGAGWRASMGVPAIRTGYTSMIRGSAEEFGIGGANGVAARPNSGDGFIGNTVGADGIVILSVPA